VAASAGWDEQLVPWLKCAQVDKESGFEHITFGELVAPGSTSSMVTHVRRSHNDMIPGGFPRDWRARESDRAV
jgi:hypothetical protein